MAEASPSRTPKDELSNRPGHLFICGCDKTGTTVLADYLNRHPEILIRRETSRTNQPGEIAPDLSPFERRLDFGPKRTGNSVLDDYGDRLTKPHAESFADRDPVRVRWIGTSNSDYVRRMEAVAGNYPGARFIVVYRPVEEITELWETKDADDHQMRLRQALKIWNRSLQGARRFIRDSLVPRVLLISYQDFLYRTEAMMPLISRFLELEFDESVKADRAGEVLQSEGGELEETPDAEIRYFIEKHANCAAEAWILDRIDKQWGRPGLYTQESSRAALASSLDEMEARTWRLQQKVKELEREEDRRRRTFKQLISSRTWKLVNKISSLRAKMPGR